MSSNVGKVFFFFMSQLVIWSNIGMTRFSGNGINLTTDHLLLSQQTNSHIIKKMT